MASTSPDANASKYARMTSELVTAIEAAVSPRAACERLVAEVLSVQPGNGRLEAGRIVDAWLPAEQLSRFAIAEILVLAKHVHGLSREQRPCRETGGPVQEAVAVLDGKSKPVREPVRHAPSDLPAAEALGQAARELLPADVEAIADVERVAGRGLVSERKHDGIHHIVDVAQPGDRATAVDEDHRAPADRPRDLANDLG